MSTPRFKFWKLPWLQTSERPPTPQTKVTYYCSIQRLGLQQRMDSLSIRSTKPGLAEAVLWLDPDVLDGRAPVATICWCACMCSSCRGRYQLVLSVPGVTQCTPQRYQCSLLSRGSASCKVVNTSRSSGPRYLRKPFAATHRCSIQPWIQGQMCGHPSLGCCLVGQGGAPGLLSAGLRHVQWDNCMVRL